MDRLIPEPTRLCIVAVARRPVVACPVCGYLAHRVHSRYERRLADLPWHGLAVTLHLVVRRFVCETPDCRRRLFCERVPQTAVAYARRTRRLTTVLGVLGLASGGEAGARLAAALRMTTSPDTLLRVTQAVPLGSALDEPILVLGVDDWAWRRGQRYGTILVDLERGRVVDLLPTREPEPLIAWLRAHPAVAIVSRDRASGYAEAARRGAPAAIQVADWFHFLRNLTETLARTLERHQAVVRTVAPPVASRAPPTPAPVSRRTGPVAQQTPQPRLAERRKTATRERRQARYADVVALQARGLSQVAIGRLAGVSRGPVSRWLAGGHFPSAARARRGRQRSARMPRISERAGQTAVTMPPASGVSCARGTAFRAGRRRCAAGFSSTFAMAEATADAWAARLTRGQPRRIDPHISPCGEPRGS